MNAVTGKNGQVLIGNATVIYINNRSAVCGSDGFDLFIEVYQRIPIPVNGRVVLIPEPRVTGKQCTAVNCSVRIQRFNFLERC